MLYKGLPVKHSLLLLKESSMAGSQAKLPIDIVVKRVPNVSINSLIITAANVPQRETKKTPIGVSTNFTRNMWLSKNTVLQKYGHVSSSGSISDRSLSSAENNNKIPSKRPTYLNNNKTLDNRSKPNITCDASNGSIAALNSGGSQLFNASIF
jgi:hypothetical protein